MLTEKFVVAVWDKAGKAPVKSNSPPARKLNRGAASEISFISVLLDYNL
jgi:hypothetical protein